MPSDGDFIGSAVQMYVAGSARGGLFQDVYLRKFGGRDYLVGKLRTFGNDSRDGLETWSALEAVSMWIKFPDLEAMLRYKNAMDEEEERRRWQS
jgi:hypothetical protein